MAGRFPRILKGFTDLVPMGRYGLWNMQQIGAAPSLQMDLNDLGNGIVDISMQIGVGPVSYSRATPGWTKLSTGLWASVGSGLARSFYTGMNTAVGVYGGYLSEPAATQLITPTAAIRDMTDPSWVATNITPVKSATGIDGVAANSSTLTATAANGTILYTLVAAAVQRTYSAWVRRTVGVGQILLLHGGATLDITALINGVTKTQVLLPANVLNPAVGFQIVTSGDAITVDFNQFELGSDASSPVDTAGATRNSDILTVPVAGNIDGNTGSVYCEACSSGTGTLALLGTNANGRFIDSAAPGAARTIDSVTNIASCVITPNLSINAISRIAASWSATSGMKNCANGGAVGVQAAFAGMSTTNPFGIGCFSTGGNQMKGGIKKVRAYRPAFLETQLQQMTS